MLQVDQAPEDIAELTAGVAGRTVDDWQMPMGSRPGDIVIWYAAGRKQYIARGRVDDLPTRLGKVPGPIAARLLVWSGSNRWTEGR